MALTASTSFISRRLRTFRILIRVPYDIGKSRQIRHPRNVDVDRLQSTEGGIRLFLEV